MSDASAIPVVSPPAPTSRPRRRPLRAIGRFLARWWRRLGTLSPHALFFGAVFQKEMRVAGRKNSTFIVRTVYAMLLVGLAVLVFLANRPGGANQVGAAALQQLQEVAPGVTTAILWFQMIFLPLIAAMLAGPSVCDEVRARSLPALLTSPLTAAQIIGSKLASGMVSVAVLALVSVPLLLGLRLFGGVDAEVVLAGSAITLSAALLAGTMGMLVSVFARRSALAGSVAIGATLGLMIAPGAVVFLLMSRGVLGQTEAIQVFGASCSPATLTMVMALASGNPGPPGVEISGLWASNSLYNVGASILLLMLASMAFRGRLTGDRGEEILGAADRPVVVKRGKKPRVSKPRAGTDGGVESSGTPVPASDGAPAGPADSGDSRGGVTGSAASVLEVAPAVAPPAARAPAFARAHSRTLGEHPVLWRELRRQGTRSASRRKGLTGALMSLAILAVLGVFLPVYGAWEGMRSASSEWLAFGGRGPTALLVATGVFAVFVGGLVALTLFRALKRVGLGHAVVVPPRQLAICCQVLGVLLFAYWMTEGELEPLHYAVAALGQGLVLLRAATQNAGSLAEEREARTWETLLTTRLSPREILLGKLTGSLARQWDLPALVLVHFVFAGVVLDRLPPWIVVHLTFTMVAGVALLSGTGVLLALLTPKGSVASILNTCLALVLWLIFPIAIGFGVSALRLESTTQNTIAGVVLGANPVALGMFALNGAIESNNDGSGWSGGGEPTYWVAGVSVTLMQFTLVTLGVCAVYVVLGWVAFLRACRIFNSRTGRTS